MSAFGNRKVSEIMDKKLVAVSPSATIRSAIRLTQTSGVDLLLVVERSRLVGVVGEEDLLNYISSNTEKRMGESIQGIVKRAVYVEAGDTVAVAIAKTIDNNLSRLPVVESSATMRCVGIVTTTELLKEAAK